MKVTIGYDIVKDAYVLLKDDGKEFLLWRESVSELNEFVKDAGEECLNWWPQKMPGDADSAFKSDFKANPLIDLPPHTKTRDDVEYFKCVPLETKIPKVNA